MKYEIKFWNYDANEAQYDSVVAKSKDEAAEAWASEADQIYGEDGYRVIEVKEWKGSGQEYYNRAYDRADRAHRQLMDMAAGYAD